MKHERISVEGAASDQDNRRALISMTCEVRQGSRPWQRVRIDEISRAGFRIPQIATLSPELPLRIRMPGMAVLNASVRWHSGQAAGCQFSEPLHVAVFEHIVAQMR